MDSRILRINDGGSGLSIALFRRVTNAAELRKEISESGSSSAGGSSSSVLRDVSLLKAEMVADPMQAAAAARRAQINQSRAKMTTRSWATEVIFNISGSRNITESLKTFGIGDADADLLVVVKGSEEGREKEVAGRISGELVDLAELEEVTDWGKVKKAHKLKGLEEENGVGLEMLRSLLVSRAASKDISL